jgi:hypothetical protein
MLALSASTQRISGSRTHKGGISAEHQHSSRQLAAIAGSGPPESVGVLFAPGPPPFDQVAIGQAEFVLQSRQQSQQFLLLRFRARLMRESGINRVLKSSNRQRIEFGAADEVTAGYLSYVWTELIYGQVTAEIAVEQVYQQRSFGAEPAAPVGQ